MADVRAIIEKKLKTNEGFTAAEIIRATGISRAYVSRILQEYQHKGVILLVGKANRARYIRTQARIIEKARREELSFRRHLTMPGVSEDTVLEEIKRETGIFIGLPECIARILDYTFTEMLNNAIEHSGSTDITVVMKSEQDGVGFRVVDRGIGIFQNLLQQRHLQTTIEAIQDLLKGKQTTAPQQHSGEGIFFTSKVADMLVIKGSDKKLLFNNLVGDVFVRSIRPIIGTQVEFWIGKKSRRTLKDLFDHYAGETFKFERTQVAVNLYALDSDYISRSQARRILSGLEKFKTVVLDFEKVQTVGQAFADEVFRVWKHMHPEQEILIKNANEDVFLMIEHVDSHGST